MTPAPNTPLKDNASSALTAATKKKKASYKATLRSAGGTDATTNGPITALHPYDVIVGRGAPTAFYEGNVKFRSLAALHKDAYMAGERHHPKQAIALQVMDEVHKLGGRFMSEIATTKNQAKQFRVVSHEVALEKVKQVLRANKGSCDDVPMASMETADPSAALGLPLTAVTAPEEDERKPAAVTTTLPTPAAPNETSRTLTTRSDKRSHPLPMSIESVLSNSAVHPGLAPETDSDDESQDGTVTPPLAPTINSLAFHAASAVAALPPSVDSIASLQNVLLARQVLVQRQANLRRQQQVALLNVQAAMMQQQVQQQAQQQAQYLLQPQLVWNTPSQLLQSSLWGSSLHVPVVAEPSTHWLLASNVGLGNPLYTSGLLGTAGLFQPLSPLHTTAAVIPGWNAMAPPPSTGLWTQPLATNALATALANVQAQRFHTATFHDPNTAATQWPHSDAQWPYSTP